MMLSQDITTGVFDRFRALPIARWAPLAGAILGDMVRYLISIPVTLGFGLRPRVPGARPTRSPPSRAACSWWPSRSPCAGCRPCIGVLVKSAAGRAAVRASCSMFPLVFGSNILAPTEHHAGLAAGVRQGQPGHLPDRRGARPAHRRPGRRRRGPARCCGRSASSWCSRRSPSASTAAAPSGAAPAWRLATGPFRRPRGRARRRGQAAAAGVRGRRTPRHRARRRPSPAPGERPGCSRRRRRAPCARRRAAWRRPSRLRPGDRGGRDRVDHGGERRVLHPAGGGLQRLGEQVAAAAGVPAASSVIMASRAWDCARTETHHAASLSRFATPASAASQWRAARGEVPGPPLHLGGAEHQPLVGVVLGAGRGGALGPAQVGAGAVDVAGPRPCHRQRADDVRPVAPGVDFEADLLRLRQCGHRLRVIRAERGELGHLVEAHRDSPRVADHAELLEGRRGSRPRPRPGVPRWRRTRGAVHAPGGPHPGVVRRLGVPVDRGDRGVGVTVRTWPPAAQRPRPWDGWAARRRRTWSGSRSRRPAARGPLSGSASR